MRRLGGSRHETGGEPCSSPTQGTSSGECQPQAGIEVEASLQAAPGSGDVLELAFVAGEVAVEPGLIQVLQSADQDQSRRLDWIQPSGCLNGLASRTRDG